MKTIFIFILGVVSTLTLSAQKVDQIFRAKDASRLKPSTIFELIDPRTEIDTYKPIASYKLTIEKGGKNNMIDTYNKLRDKASQIGANCFSIEQVNFINNRYIVRVSVFLLSKTQLKNNLRNYDRNYVALIGNLDTKKDDKPHIFFVNGQQCEVVPHSYMYLLLGDGDKLDVTLETVDGSNLTMIGRDGKLASFLAKGKVFETVGFDLGTSFMTQDQAPEKKKKKDKRPTIDGLVEYDRPTGNFVLIVLDNAHPIGTADAPAPATNEEVAPVVNIEPTITDAAPEQAAPVVAEPKPMDAKTRLKEQLDKSRKK